MKKLLAVILSALLLFTALPFSAAAGEIASATAANSTVTVIDYNGNETVYDVKVGEVFTLVSCLNISDIDRRVLSVDANVTYDSDMLELLVPLYYDEDLEEEVLDAAKMFPQIAKKADPTVNYTLKNKLVFNASVSSFGFLFDKDTCVLVQADFKVTAPGNTEIRVNITTLSVELEGKLVKVIAMGEQIVDGTIAAPSAVEVIEPGEDDPTEPATAGPTEGPTAEPTEAPTEEPTPEPTEASTEAPTPEPTEAPTEAPTPEPTEAPTEAPTPEPTEEPTSEPTEAPAEPIPTEPGDPVGSVLKGDADSDGRVIIQDATFIQKALAGMDGFPVYDAAPKDSLLFRTVDIDGDGRVTIQDATLIQKWLAGMSEADHFGIKEFIYG